MTRSYSDIKKTFEFVIKLVETISIKRENMRSMEQCESMREKIHSLQDEHELLEFRITLLNLIDDVKFIIQTEKRYFLFPLPDIKQEAFELGKKYMNNFLEWIKPGDNLSVEEIIKILEDELHLLEEAKKILEKIENNRE